MANEKRLDLIDRNKLKSEFEWLKSVVNESSKYEIQEHIQRIEDAPAVDAVEVVHGRWVLLAEFCDRSVCTKCSVCGEEYTYKKGKFEFINAHYAGYNYCPNCGANMMDGDGNV